MYPYMKTTQNLKAISYTTVPTSIRVFLSQRRRWNLGAMTNDMLLVYFPGINIFERILAFVNILTFTLTPFIFVATIVFIISIISHPTMLMLYLGSLLLIPVLYSFLIPIFIKPEPFLTSMYYYLSYLIFLSCSGIINLFCFTYSILHMDVITWGKTRSITNSDNTENIIVINDIDSNAIDSNTNETDSNATDSNDIDSNSNETDNKKNNKDIKDGYIELEYDYNYLEINMNNNALKSNLILTEV